MTAQRALEIRELAEQGLGQRQVADRVQLSRATVHRVLGQLPAVPAPANSQLPSELSVFPPPEPRQEERELARTGALDEAELVYNQGRKLSLLGLPPPHDLAGAGRQVVGPPGSFGTSSTGIARR